TSWIEHGPTTTSSRGSSRRKIRMTASRPPTTVALAASVIGKSAFNLPGATRRTISRTCRLWVRNIGGTISGTKADESLSWAMRRTLKANIEAAAPVVGMRNLAPDLWQLLCGGSPDGGIAQEVHQLAGIVRRADVEVVVEIHVSLSAGRGLIAKALRPRSQFTSLVIVIRPAFQAVKAHVNEIGGHDFPARRKLERADPDEGGVVFAKDGVGVVVEPGLVPELERMAVRGRQAPEKFFQAPEILFQKRRQLPQHRIDPRRQRFDPGEIAVHSVRDALDFQDVRDEPAALDREDESFRRAVPPAFDHVFRGQTIEGRVDFHGRE